MSIEGFQASTRFGLGATPDELALIKADPRGWLKDQVLNPVYPSILRNLKHPSLQPSTGDMSDVQKQEFQKEKRKESRDLYVSQTAERFLLHKRTPQPFLERLVMFWSNHFTVSVSKNTLVGYVNLFEAEAIRPHVTGKFSDMLLAVTRHPAMLEYLDNARSIGPNSVRGRRRERGLNENLAREIMELHTLGVNGGYTQTDIIEFAKILTGWSVVRGNGSFSYAFQPAIHEPGTKMLLGKVYQEKGEAEGIMALLSLARHPATAAHIATKLARHFISDTPPQSAIDKLSRVFIETEGDLKQVSLALIDLEECWNAPLTKYKTPYEYLVSSVRLLDLEPAQKRIMQMFNTLNYRAFAATSPAGYADTADIWMSPDGVMKRIELAHSLANAISAKIDPLVLADQAFGPVMRGETAFIIKGAPSGVEGIAFVLSAPEFMRR